jgi:Do/DeqQ family serine protease
MRTEESRHARRVGYLAGGVAGALLSFTVVGAWRAADVPAAATAAPQVAAAAAPAPPISATTPVTSYAGVVDRVAPAVVTIRTEHKAQAMPTSSRQLPPELREFFGGRGLDVPGPRGPERGLGSGVIVSADGYILTNNHVIDEADVVRVELPDRRVFDAKVVGTDPASDLAVLKVGASGLRALSLGDSERVRVGDVVLAVGNPLGVGQTVTMGIISGKSRQTSGGDSFEDFLQTDAPINRGNSGGALVNLNGELVGINSQILSPSGGSIGVGFAIPANMARNVMGQLIKTGSVRRAKLGVTAQNITGDIAASLGLDRVSGALVSNVDPTSPAARAGIEQGDVILAVNDHPVDDSNALRNAISAMEPGSRATISVLRNGQRQSLQATLAELKTARQRGDDEQPAGHPAAGRFGMSVEPVTPDLADQLGMPRSTKGVAVVDLDPSGAAAEAGVQEGDVIAKVNGHDVQSGADLRSALESAGTKPALLLVHRKDATIFIPLRAPAA